MDKGRQTALREALKTHDARLKELQRRLISRKRDSYCDRGRCGNCYRLRDEHCLRTRLEADEKEKATRLVLLEEECNQIRSQAAQQAEEMQQQHVTCRHLTEQLTESGAKLKERTQKSAPICITSCGRILDQASRNQERMCATEQSKRVLGRHCQCTDTQSTTTDKRVPDTTVHRS